jgi:integrase
MQDAIHLDDDTVSRLLSGMRDALFGRRHPHRQGGPGAMPSAWIRQDDKHVAKVGKEKASHYVHWIDPEGRQRCRSCGPGPAGLERAEKLKRQIEDDLTLGTYQLGGSKTWAEFRREYEAKVLAGRAPETRRQVRRSLDHFERLVRPKKVSAVRTKTIDDFSAARRQERAQRRKGEAPAVSPATVNADLRNVKAALAVAKRWGYLAEVPEFASVRQPRKLPRYVPPEHFAALYLACDGAGYPKGLQGFTPADWWRGLLVFAYVATGWRIGQCLGLLWEDVDLAAGTVVGRASVSGNKADRDVLVRLHPVAVEHLERLRGFGPNVFPWPHCESETRQQLYRLCKRAGVPRYGWHAFRKGFGTMNAKRLGPMELAWLMQHADLDTTRQFYVDPRAVQDDAVSRLHVPDVLRRRTG